MKIAHIADVHLDRPFVGRSESEGERARRRLMETFKRALAIAREQGVELITIGGDLWEAENVRVDTRRAVALELGGLGVDVVVICGNHDAWVPGGAHDRTEWPANVRVVTSSAPEEIRIGEVSVWAASWVGREMNAGFLREVRTSPERANILLIHGTARATGFFHEEDVHCPFDPAVAREAGFALCLAGHIHHGSYEQGVVYPGSPEPLGWSEDGMHSVAIVEVGPGAEPRVELVPTHAHRYLRIEADCGGAESSGEIEARLEARLRAEAIGRDGTVHVRAKLLGEIDPLCVVDAEALAESCREGLAELKVVDRTVPGFDIEAIMNRETVDGIFVRRIQRLIEEEGDDHERLQRLQEGMYVGLRALAGREEVIHVD